jgi:hypothetical protein
MTANTMTKRNRTKTLNDPQNIHRIHKRTDNTMIKRNRIKTLNDPQNTHRKLLTKGYIKTTFVFAESDIIWKVTVCYNQATCYRLFSKCVYEL